MPVPPQELWDGHWSDPAEYLGSGKKHFDAMMDIVYTSGFLFRPKARVLDFGCGTGRIMRRFRSLTNEREVYGADIRAKHVLWSLQHLCPPFKFVTVTAFPHLPFEDAYFDLIYAGSVFTHISDLADAWLLELRRILRPEGRCYITVRDQHSIEAILSAGSGHPYPGLMREELLKLEREKNLLSSGFSMAVINKGPEKTEVFYHLDYLRRVWGAFFHILSVTPRAFGNQTAVLLSKP